MKRSRSPQDGAEPIADSTGSDTNTNTAILPVADGTGGFDRSTRGLPPLIWQEAYHRGVFNRLSVRLPPRNESAQTTVDNIVILRAYALRYDDFHTLPRPNRPPCASLAVFAF